MRKRGIDSIFLSALLLLLLAFYSRMLFTSEIIRAPDIINEFYWNVRDIANSSLIEAFRINLKASWSPLINSGYSVGGGDASIGFLIWKKLLFSILPLPSSIAWFIVLHLFFGAAGVYFCCRAIKTGRLAAFAGGAIFALAPELASLINAGHVMKIATISYAPWAFYLLERGFQTRRLIFFLSTSVVLAFQFFNTHWQIAFYTCLSIAAYGMARLVSSIIKPEFNRNEAARLLFYNAFLLIFFLSTVSISLLPLADWSKETNRGVQSGSDSGSAGTRGGLDRDEAMSWSLPPEEISTFIIPGFFGFSRQEAGENPKNIDAYYWGRMRFTQTTDYFGLLPWLLLPLPLIFRRDIYSWILSAGIAGGILFSMGKYTPFYNFLYDYFPGINHFRVPKMMMFIPLTAIAILAARGIDLLMDDEVRATIAFRKYLLGILALPVILLSALAAEKAGAGGWIPAFIDNLSQLTRYGQGGGLVIRRWENIMAETSVATVISAIYAAVFLAFQAPLVNSCKTGSQDTLSGRRYLLALARLPFTGNKAAKYLPWILLAIFAVDVYRVDSKFIFLVPPPQKPGGNVAIPPEIAFLSAIPPIYRVLPMDGSDPMIYASRNIPVMFTPNAVQQRRWQEFLESFTLAGPMPDMLNVRYLILKKNDYLVQKAYIPSKYRPVFSDSGSDQVILENSRVLPKGWLVPAVEVAGDTAKRLSLLKNPEFNPKAVALVDSPPPFPLPAAPGGNIREILPDRVVTELYEGERIVLKADAPTDALLVLGEKYDLGWRCRIDGKSAGIVPVNHVLRGVYLKEGRHRIEFVYDPLPFRIGKNLTLASFGFFGLMLMREWRKKDKNCPS